MLRGDQFYMGLALRVATVGQGICKQDPMVGSVIVKNGRVISSGYHGAPKSLHAEAMAIERADHRITDADLYVTLEPCCHVGNNPPCVDAVIASGVRRVIIAMLDPNPIVKSCDSIVQLKEAGIEVVIGVCFEDAAKLNAVFIKRVTEKKCFVHYKIAQSLDGKTALANGKSQWITSQRSRDWVHFLRHSYDGIMVGADTVLSDEPLLSVRSPKPKPILGVSQPIRILLDARRRIDADSGFFQNSSQATLVYYLKQSESNHVERSMAHVTFIESLECDGKIDLAWVLRDLFEREIFSVFLESGGALGTAMIDNELIDRMTFIIGNCIIGSEGKSGVRGLALTDLSRAKALCFMSSNRLGCDVIIDGYFIDPTVSL
jgi:diaminohydroxyphosphoribosylaminopyrimidine deaminase / 5-amino-6-(5-phosphoribosylamino)uracil reductase